MSFFADTVATPKEGVELHKKSALKRQRVEKASNKTINKIHAEYKQYELNGKGKIIGKHLGKHVTSIYSKGVSKVVKIIYVKKLHQDTENDLIISSQMANLGCHLTLFRMGHTYLPHIS